MNNYINYYYNLYPEEIHQQSSFFYFHLDNEKYYFMVYNRPTDEINEVYELNVEMLNRNSLVHEIIINKDKQALTFINNIPYILLKVYVNENKKVDLAEVTFFSSQMENVNNKKKLVRTDWVQLWSYKIDYFEYQISQVGKKYPLLCESLSYFIGLGENAILYIKNTIQELKPAMYDNLTVAHKRIQDYFTMFDLYNPISLVIDYKTRDLSEYIKTSFFAGKDVWSEIDEYFKHNILSLYNVRMLYGRLLFPSYFFDMYERVVEEGLKEETVMAIISKVTEYEHFLNEFYQYISANISIPSIAWLNKKTTQ